MEQQTANQQPQNKQIVYKTQGTCSQYIEVTLTDGLISSCRFYGGCDGNTKGLAKLVIGMRPADVINRLSGITCGRKPTSCPDQLCQALKQLQEGEE
ncbi:MAG: TIGR03905 family TSCPD domain-containing protein [Bacteroidaceae bacterium]|nr:TIGR03905 family TSCPD domain-containing protein [Bacteroidaceae bacterium]